MILRYVFLLVSIIFYYLLQVSVLPEILPFEITPNLLLCFVIIYSFIRGRRKGLWLGCICGLVFDIMLGDLPGFYTALFTVIAYLSGLFGNNLNPEDPRYSLSFTFVGELIYGFVIYVAWFAFRGDAGFFTYLSTVILPECILTTIFGLIIGPLTGSFNQRLEKHEKRSAVKFG